MYNNLAPLDRTSYLLITFFLAISVLLDALLFFVTHMGSMLYISFHSGQNGRKISYRHANRYEAPPCSTSAKISACFGLFRPVYVIRPEYFFGSFFFFFFLCSPSSPPLLLLLLLTMHPENGVWSWDFGHGV
jgi:hypothetical protein